MDKNSIRMSRASAMTIIAAVKSSIRAKNSPLFSRLKPMISSLVQANSTVARPAKINRMRKKDARPSTTTRSPMMDRPPVRPESFRPAAA